MGLSEAEVWEIERWQFLALLERRNAHYERLDVYVDTLCRLLANPYRSPGAEPYGAGSFFGRRPKQREQTPDELKAILVAAARGRRKKGSTDGQGS